MIVKSFAFPLKEIAASISRFYQRKFLFKVEEKCLKLTVTFHFFSKYLVP